MWSTAVLPVEGRGNPATGSVFAVSQQIVMPSMAKDSYGIHPRQKQSFQHHSQVVTLLVQELFQERSKYS